MHLSQYLPSWPAEQFTQVGSPSFESTQVLANWFMAFGPAGHGQGLQSSDVPLVALPYQPSEHFSQWSPNKEYKKVSKEEKIRTEASKWFKKLEIHFQCCKKSWTANNSVEEAVLRPSLKQQCHYSKSSGRKWGESLNKIKPTLMLYLRNDGKS